jgi:hypothetical protein
MRTPVALRVALGLVLSAQLAGAETPASAPTEPSAAPAPKAAPPPAAPAAGTATTDTASPGTAAPNAPDTAAAPDAATTPGTPTPGADGSEPVVVPAESDQFALEPIPSARDTLGGHFVLGASAGAKWLFGSLEEGQKANDILGTALALNLDLGYGLSRNVVIGLWGELDNHSKPSGCPTCEGGKSFAGGPFIRYHLVQGTRFDPWGALALGVRSTNTDTSIGSKDYVGVDLLKLTLGGDWYPTSNVGFGPYVTFDWGTYGSGGGHTGLGTGLRLVLDLPGK